MSKVKATPKFYMVDLMLKANIGARKIPMDYLGIKITDPNLSEKFNQYVDNTKVHIVPLEKRKELINFKAKVRNSLTVNFVPFGYGSNTIRLMSESMMKKAMEEYNDLSKEFESIYNSIDKLYNSYEKEFYKLFNEILKGNPEKANIIKELKLTMPGKDEYLNSLIFEFKTKIITGTKDIEDRFVGKALSIVYDRVCNVEQMAIERDGVHSRTLFAISKDIEEIESLGVKSPIIKEMVAYLKEIQSIKGNGKASATKAKKARIKAMQYADKLDALDMVYFKRK